MSGVPRLHVVFHLVPVFAVHPHGFKELFVLLGGPAALIVLTRGRVCFLFWFLLGVLFDFGCAFVVIGWVLVLGLRGLVHILGGSIVEEGLLLVFIGVDAIFEAKLALIVLFAVVFRQNIEVEVYLIVHILKLLFLGIFVEDFELILLAISASEGPLRVSLIEQIHSIVLLG